MKVFISYSEHDGAAGARFVYGALSGRAGIDVWLDRERLKPGAKFSEELRAQARAADVGVLVFSAGVTKSDWCRRERKLLLKGKAKLIPVLWDGKRGDYAQLRGVGGRVFHSRRGALSAVTPLELDAELQSLVDRVVDIASAVSQGTAKASPATHKHKRYSLSEWLAARADATTSGSSGPVAFRTALRQQFGAKVAAALREADPIANAPELYFQTLVKALWRANLLDAAFFAWLGREYGGAAAVLKRLEDDYAPSFPGARHRDGAAMTKESAGFLDRLLHVREFGLVLRPHDVQPEGPGDFFQIASGRVQNRFVTIWELYDEPAEYRACIEALAKLVTDSLPELAPSCLVTSTVTGRHLVDSIRAKLDDSRRSLAVHYLSPELTLDEETGEVPDLRHKRALLVTDVIATMSTIDNLTGAVGRCGGHVVGAIAAIYIGGGGSRGKSNVVTPLVPRLSVPFEGARTEFRVVQMRTAFDVDVWALSHYRIDQLKPKAATRLIPMDPATILPVQQEELGETTEPLFDSLHTTIESLDAVRALRFGLFRSDGRVVTASVLFEPLLKNRSAPEAGARPPRLDVAASIREKLQTMAAKHAMLKEPEASSLRLVTTHRQNDVEFADFVQDCLKIPAALRVHLPRREGTRSPNPFVLMSQKVAHLQGCNVLVVLGTIDSSDSLRAVVSLLASAGVQSVFVLTLLSRMRFYSTNFLARVDRILDEALDPSQRRLLEVRFRTVFELPEVETVVLQRLVATVRDVGAGYRRSGAAIGLVRLGDNELKHFEPQSLSGPSTALMRPKALPRKMARALPEGARQLHHSAGEVKDFSTVDALLFLVSRDVTPLRSYRSTSPGHRVLERRDPERLLELLCDPKLTFRKRHRYSLFALLLADLNYFSSRMHGDKRAGSETTRLEHVREQLEACMLRFRDARAAGIGKKALLASKDEGQLLFLIALLGAIDNHQKAPRAFYQRVFTCSFQDLVENGSLRDHAVGHLTNERTILALSMLYHLRLSSDRERGGREVVREARRVLEHEVRPAIQRAVRERASLRRRNDTQLRSLQLARNRVDTLLYDFGARAERNRAWVVRHLHAALYGLEGEDPLLRRSITELAQRLRALLHDTTAAPKPRSRRRSSGPAANFRYLKPEDGSLAKTILDEALLGCGDLERVARSVRDLFLFAGGLAEEPTVLLPYMDEQPLEDTSPVEREPSPGLPTAAGRLALVTAIRRLSDLLYAIRQRRKIVISYLELEELERTVARVTELLWGADVLRRALAFYIVDLKETWGAAVSGIEAMGVPVPDDWAYVLDEPLTGAVFVLSDRVMLEDLLKDFMTRAFMELTDGGSDRVGISVQHRLLTGTVGAGQNPSTSSSLVVVEAIEDASWIELEIFVGGDETNSDDSELGESWERTRTAAKQLAGYDGSFEVSRRNGPRAGIAARLRLRTRPTILAEKLAGEENDVNGDSESSTEREAG